MTDKKHAYDPDLPYVVVTDGNELAARFRLDFEADSYARSHTSLRVIDTTPAPPVPEDARFIMWEVVDGPYRVARRNKDGWQLRSNGVSVPIANLPGVTPNTEFIVLDER